MSVSSWPSKSAVGIRCISDSVRCMLLSTSKLSHYIAVKTKAPKVSESDFAKATELEGRSFWIQNFKFWVQSLCTFNLVSFFLEIKKASNSELMAIAITWSFVCLFVCLFSFSKVNHVPAMCWLWTTSWEYNGEQKVIQNPLSRNFYEQ